MRNALLIVASSLIVVSIGFMYWPFALLVAGILLGAFVLLSE